MTLGGFGGAIVCRYLVLPFWICMISIGRVRVMCRLGTLNVVGPTISGTFVNLSSSAATFAVSSEPASSTAFA